MHAYINTQERETHTHTPTRAQVSKTKIAILPGLVEGGGSIDQGTWSRTGGLEMV